MLGAGAARSEGRVVASRAGAGETRVGAGVGAARWAGLLVGVVVPVCRGVALEVTPDAGAAWMRVAGRAAGRSGSALKA